MILRIICKYRHQNEFKTMEIFNLKANYFLSTIIIPNKMRKTVLWLIALVIVASCQKDNIQDYPVRPVPFMNVKVNDNFWLPRIITNREITIPYSFRMCEETGRINNFIYAAGIKQGKFCSVFPFDDSDVYKILEGAAYSLHTYPDVKLETYCDSIIRIIAMTQEPDGYLMTWRQIDPLSPPTSWSGGKDRWSDISNGHELYNMGHLYEAAVAYYQATGKRQLLDVALKSADLVWDVFGPGKRDSVPGHEEIEIGLVKLYRVTGDLKYLEMAKLFIDRRGSKKYNPEGKNLWETGAYWQNHLPVTQQREAVGHAVRAGYLYSGMADVSALFDNREYKLALDYIWNNVVGKKIYLTGGVGASGTGEAFGRDYELPNAEAYAETCAAIAQIFWNHRMFLLTGESKYIDVLERVLYNGSISGVSLEGNSFFYPNVLESNGAKRNPWFPCSCCPSNITRFIPSVPGYIYASREDTLFINLFVGSEAVTDIKGRQIKIRQETQYPWDGNIRITVDPEKSVSFILKIRIPGWARNKPIPGDLYTYSGGTGSQIMLKVNTEIIPADNYSDYIILSRKWKKGDRIEINIDMPVKLVVANENVKADSGKMAIERGPVVYCAESIDNDANVLDLCISDNSKWSTERMPELLKGITVIKGKAYLLSVRNSSYIEKEFTAIPYYAWAHRGESEMAVWFRTCP
jgi:DUF1680 family protein